MIAFVCISFAMLVLVCVVAVCVHFAKDGFEDAEGFHSLEASDLSDFQTASVSRQRKMGVPPAEPVAAPLELAAEAE